MCRQMVERLIKGRRGVNNSETSRLVMRLVTNQLTDLQEIRKAEQALKRIPQKIVW